MELKKEKTVMTKKTRKEYTSEKTGDLRIKIKKPTRKKLRRNLSLKKYNESIFKQLLDTISTGPSTSGGNAALGQANVSRNPIIEDPCHQKTVSSNVYNQGASCSYDHYRGRQIQTVDMQTPSTDEACLQNYINVYNKGAGFSYDYSKSGHSQTADTALQKPSSCQANLRKNSPFRHDEGANFSYNHGRSGDIQTADDELQKFSINEAWLQNNATASSSNDHNKHGQINKVALQKSITHQVDFQHNAIVSSHAYNQEAGILYDHRHSQTSNVASQRPMKACLQNNVTLNVKSQGSNLPNFDNRHLTEPTEDLLHNSATEETCSPETSTQTININNGCINQPKMHVALQNSSENNLYCQEFLKQSSDIDNEKASTSDDEITFIGEVKGAKDSVKNRRRQRVGMTESRLCEIKIKHTKEEIFAAAIKAGKCKIAPPIQRPLYWTRTPTSSAVIWNPVYDEF